MTEKNKGIKDILGEIKGKSSGREVKPAEKAAKTDKKPVESVKTTVERKEPLTVPDEGVNSNKLDDFLVFVDKVNKIDHFNIGGTIYVDTDVHEVLQGLKGSAKLQISKLASHLFAEFIENNKEAIVEILSRKSNKFLD